LSDALGRLIVASFSGVLSYAACFVLEPAGTRWGAGVVFGLLVLGPSQRRGARFGGLAVLSTAVYRAAVWSAQQLHTENGVPAAAACALAGAAGAALLALGSAALIQRPADIRATGFGAALGAAGGALIGVALEMPDGSFALHGLLLGGFVVWQVGYAAAHRLPSWSRA